MPRTLAALDRDLAAAEADLARLRRIVKAMSERIKPDVTVEPATAADPGRVRRRMRKSRTDWEGRTPEGD